LAWNSFPNHPEGDGKEAHMYAPTPLALKPFFLSITVQNFKTSLNGTGIVPTSQVCVTAMLVLFMMELLNIAVEWVACLLHIQEVTDSNLEQ
jgi:hypothetical protein